MCIDVNTMGIITEDVALKPDKLPISFNVRYIEEAIKFIMCSDDADIEIYYTGNVNGLILKSGRLYALVMPVRMK